MKQIETLQQVLVEQLKDLYSAENQLIKALPKMAKAASAPDLKQGFETHLEQTKVHAERIADICEELKEKPTGKKCKAMEGLIAEGAEAIEEEATPEARDLLLIAAARRVEHYEIAAYNGVYSFAKSLGMVEVAKTLKSTLTEEEVTDGKLSDLSLKGCDALESVAA